MTFTENELIIIRQALKLRLAMLIQSVLINKNTIAETKRLLKKLGEPNND